jgi:hypothetical protein
LPPIKLYFGQAKKIGSASCLSAPVNLKTEGIKIVKEGFRQIGMNKIKS